MNRILFESEEVVDNRVTFGGVRAEHVLNVLHGTVGQVLKTGIVNGRLGTSTIESIEPLPLDPSTGLAQGRVTVRCTHATPALAPWADLLLAPPRPRAMKRLLPQLALMGVGRIVLVGAEKVEKAFWGAQLLKENIYRPLLLDGLMQAGTTALPVIQVERSFRHYLEKGRFDADFAASTARYVAHPTKEGTASLPNRVDLPQCVATAPSPSHLQPPARTLIAVGPEGGWTDDEVARLEAKGFVRLSLGSRILRTDTAAIALLARLLPPE